MTKSYELKKKKVNHCTEIDAESLLQHIKSSDEQIRAKAVRSLCPCHVGWQTFEQHLSVVLLLTHDPSPIVRANALHVFEDAGEMEGEGITTHPSMATNEMVRAKRASRFRSDPEELSARRWDKNSRRRKIVSASC